MRFSRSALLRTLTKPRACSTGHYVGWTASPQTLPDGSPDFDADPDKQEWFKFDDEKVSLISREKILGLEGGGEPLLSSCPRAMRAVTELFDCTSHRRGPLRLHPLVQEQEPCLKKRDNLSCRANEILKLERMEHGIGSRCRRKQEERTKTSEGQLALTRSIVVLVRLIVDWGAVVMRFELRRRYSHCMGGWTVSARGQR